MARHWAKENPNSHIIDHKIFKLLSKYILPFSDIYQGKESRLHKSCSLVLKRKNYGRSSTRGLEYYLIRRAYRMKITDRAGRKINIHTGDHIHRCQKSEYGETWFIVKII